MCNTGFRLGFKMHELTMIAFPPGTWTGASELETRTTFHAPCKALSTVLVDFFALEESAWDRNLGRGARPTTAKWDGLLIYGTVNCAPCHVGSRTTDQQHQTTGVPQRGLNKGGPEPVLTGPALRHRTGRTADGRESTIQESNLSIMPIDQTAMP